MSERIFFISKWFINWRQIIGVWLEAFEPSVALAVPVPHEAGGGLKFFTVRMKNFHKWKIERTHSPSADFRLSFTPTFSTGFQENFFSAR
jgi:hypothetical protein